MPAASDPTSARLGVSRRTLTRGAAWTAPLVAVNVAAPAYAASCIAPYRLDWGTTTYSANTSGNGTHTGIATVPATSGPGTPLTVTFSSTVTGVMFGTPTRTPENLTVPALTGIGGVSGERGLALRHSDHGSGRLNRQTVAISFTRPVTGLTFTITDLDGSTGITSFWDSVELDGARTFTPAPNVIGAGTAIDPWRYTNGFTGVDDQSGGGNVVVNYAGTVSAVNLFFYSQTSGAEHRIFLGDFTFTAVCS